MSITQVTTWTGTPAAIELLEAASKQSAPFHESLGAKNPRLMRGHDPSWRESKVAVTPMEATDPFDHRLTRSYFPPVHSSSPSLEKQFS